MIFRLYVQVCHFAKNVLSLQLMYLCAGTISSKRTISRALYVSWNGTI